MATNQGEGKLNSKLCLAKQFFLTRICLELLIRLSFIIAYSMYPDILDKIPQKRICNFIGPNLTYRIHSISCHRKVSILWILYKYFHGICLQFHELKRSASFVTRFRYFNSEIVKSNPNFYSNSYFSRTSRLWNCILASSFCVNYDIQKWNSNVNRHFLPVWIFLFLLSVLLNDSFTLFLFIRF